MSNLERVTVNLIPQASEALEQAVELTRHSKTDTINRALQLYAFLMRITEAGGKIMTKQDGEVSVIKFL